MSVNKNIILSMVISGAFCRTCGCDGRPWNFRLCRGQRRVHRYGLGWDCSSLIRANTAIGVVLAALLFGGLKAGAQICR